MDISGFAWLVETTIVLVDTCSDKGQKAFTWRCDSFFLGGYCRREERIEEEDEE
jgi:hypothetical protein